VEFFRRRSNKDTYFYFVYSLVYVGLYIPECHFFSTELRFLQTRHSEVKRRVFDFFVSSWQKRGYFLGHATLQRAFERIHIENTKENLLGSVVGCWKLASGHLFA